MPRPPPPPPRVLPLPEPATPAAPFTAVLAVALGSRHTCALEATGRVVCWGSDGDGQLGPGKRWFASEHAHLAEGAVDIVSGRHLTCVLGPSGRVRCWGRGYERMYDSHASAVTASLGLVMMRQPDGTVLSTGAPPGVRSGDFIRGPERGLLRVVPLSGATRVSARNLMLTALMPSGELLCFTSLTGQGYGAGCPGAYIEGWHRSPGLGAVEVAVSEDTLCVLTSSGDVRCTEDAPGSAPGASPIFNGVRLPAKALKLAGGATHTCALLADRTVWCWGSNATSLGGGYRASLGRVSSPVHISGMHAVRSVVAGDDHTCAIEESGALYCWGSNGYGQVASGAPEVVKGPLRVDLPPP